MPNTLQAPTPPAPSETTLAVAAPAALAPPASALATQARAGLSEQLATIEHLTQQRHWHIAKFYCMVLVLREEAQAFDCQTDNQIPRGRGNVSKPTDLTSIFTAAGIAESRQRTARRMFDKGEEMHAVYAQKVGQKFAASMPMTELMNTPADALPAEARAKAQMFFDFIDGEKAAKSPRGGWRGGRKCGGDAEPPTAEESLEALKAQMLDFVAGVVSAPVWNHRSWTVLDDATLTRFAVLLGKRAKEIEQHVATPKPHRESLELADAK